MIYFTRNKSENESGSFNGLEVLVVEDETGGTYSLPSVNTIFINEDLFNSEKSFFKVYDYILNTFKGEVGPKQKLPAKVTEVFLCVNTAPTWFEWYDIDSHYHSF